ncbi:hypothetical protein D5018_15045 [Parashewanella curva]|uniref:Uncharacterized protein n=1 Tax=Parashewanella curva TaxID=2338552 RepID=A0A3L8PTX6_9GAMM|nr:hypothetical protein [Parashewanella curva]RLV58867.1 hypothetical protein D5018_15045 [Parashewanella curva]
MNVQGPGNGNGIQATSQQPLQSKPTTGSKIFDILIKYGWTEAKFIGKVFVAIIGEEKIATYRASLKGEQIENGNLPSSSLLNTPSSSSESLNSHESFAEIVTDEDIQPISSGDDVALKEALKHQDGTKTSKYRQPKNISQQMLSNKSSAPTLDIGDDGDLDDLTFDEASSSDETQTTTNENTNPKFTFTQTDSDPRISPFLMSPSPIERNEQDVTQKAQVKTHQLSWLEQMANLSDDKQLPSVDIDSEQYITPEEKAAALKQCDQLKQKAARAIRFKPQMTLPEANEDTQHPSGISFSNAIGKPLSKVELDKEDLQLSEAEKRAHLSRYDSASKAQSECLAQWSKLTKREHAILWAFHNKNLSLQKFQTYVANSNGLSLKELAEARVIIDSENHIKASDFCDKHKWLRDGVQSDDSDHTVLKQKLDLSEHEFAVYLNKHFDTEAAKLEPAEIQNVLMFLETAHSISVFSDLRLLHPQVQQLSSADVDATLLGLRVLVKQWTETGAQE